jgi:capsular polysaccharide export protein
MPYYAGWGLTEDRISCPRRTARRSAEEIFAAAYIRYARYVDPFTGAPATLEDTIGLLSDIVRHEKKAERPGVAVGFSLWRRSFAPHFAGRGVMYKNKVTDADAGRRVIVWSSRYDRLKNSGRLPSGIPVTFMEDGFVRSKGLGVKLTRPWSLVLDERGIYYDPRRESDLEHILQNTDMPEGLLQRAARVREMMVDGGVSKYNVGASALPDFGAKGRRVLLVPGQVEDDASIQAGTAGVCTNLDLLKETRRKNPGACILYKSHPDVETGKRKGAVPEAEALKYADRVLRDVSITALWPVVDEVHTMTSLSGFEALLRGKSVHVYGMPFYAGWGLTTDAAQNARRTRKLTIDHLVAGTIFLYPSYFDWKTKQPCNAETVIRRLSAA